MKPVWNRVWNQCEASMKPPHHQLYLFLCRHSLQSYGSCICMKPSYETKVRNQGMKPGYETGYETVIQPPHHLNYLFLCRQSLQSNGRCTGWQWRDAVWNRYETGMKPGMKPVWNHYKTATSPKLFIPLSSQPTKLWPLHWMAMARRGKKPVWNRYETRYETGMKPV